MMKKEESIYLYNEKSYYFHLLNTMKNTKLYYTINNCLL